MACRVFTIESCMDCPYVTIYYTERYILPNKEVLTWGEFRDKYPNLDTIKNVIDDGKVYLVDEDSGKILAEESWFLVVKCSKKDKEIKVVKLRDIPVRRFDISVDIPNWCPLPIEGGDRIG